MTNKVKSSNYLARHSRNVKIPIYPGWLFVSHRPDIIAALLKKFTGSEQEIPDCLGYTSQLVTPENEMVIVVGIFKPRPDIIVHEAGHAALDLAAYVGLRPMDDQEAFCYLLDWLYSAISNCLPKEKKQ